MKQTSFNATVVVVGQGMVGWKFCEKLRALDPNGHFRILAFGDEPRPAYDRVHLTEYFECRDEKKLWLGDHNWYESRNVELRTSERIVSIDRSKKVVQAANGEAFAYDKLVLATGSSAFVPPLSGIEKQGVFVYRTLEDLESIIAYARGAKSCAVIGGGLLGLEAARAIHVLGLETHVIEMAPRLMPRQLDDVGARLLKRKVEEMGVKVHVGCITNEVLGAGTVEALSIEGRDPLEVDMIVVSAGIVPNDDLARESGLEVGKRAGVVVNDLLQTTDEHIFAIGEVALHRGMIYGLVAPGYDMADVLARNLVGETAVFEGADMSAKLKLLGVDVASFGDPHADSDSNNQTIAFQDLVKGVYKKLILNADGDRLLGGILVGDASAYGQLLHYARSGDRLPADPETIILGARGDDATAANGVAALPASAQICSCNNVTKGDICARIREDGLIQLNDVKSCTSAGTGCGGCLPMVNDLLDAELAAAGKSVRRILCEHFDLTRQELFDIIRVQGIETFSELIASHGQGDGCEICKPTAASCFASLSNEMILKRHASLQDTNDRYLANIQRRGLYSVVPRIPGGEITPANLIRLGEIAQYYGLYTKITGGQRIDMFGARLDQLPDVWEDLVNEGFESGHAYAKGMRTIKSCVGSTWCRYGVDDSVGLAIRLESRYKGLRSPHKLKSAVSGCVRECAEAQSKDFGVIATDKGWNLYVCGNGGAKPRHADLLIADVDTETLIKLIDRFLMYYISTADKLMRTSTWIEKIDGGIDHVRDVVVNDSLGLAEDLEQMMQRLVDAFECEWAAVVRDPEQWKRFRLFCQQRCRR
ncbi:MAG: nitrite reductase large subunit NirB [Polyangiales bacterium]